MDVNKLIPGTTMGEAAQEKWMGELPMPDVEIAVERCAKCGAAEPMIRYHEDASRDKGCGWYATVKSNFPHLHFTCRTCLYEWIGKPLDVLLEGENSQEGPHA